MRVSSADPLTLVGNGARSRLEVEMPGTAEGVLEELLDKGTLTISAVDRLSVGKEIRPPDGVEVILTGNGNPVPRTPEANGIGMGGLLLLRVGKGPPEGPEEAVLKTKGTLIPEYWTPVPEREPREVLNGKIENKGRPDGCKEVGLVVGNCGVASTDVVIVIVVVPGADVGSVS